jgi:hypothetical protein
LPGIREHAPNPFYVNLAWPLQSPVLLYGRGWCLVKNKKILYFPFLKFLPFYLWYCIRVQIRLENLCRFFCECHRMILNWIMQKSLNNFGNSLRDRCSKIIFYHPVCHLKCYIPSFNSTLESVSFCVFKGQCFSVFQVTDFNF